MNDKNLAFDKLSMFIEDTEIIMLDISFNKHSLKSFSVAINEYSNKYSYKPNIVRGITSTTENTLLLKNKYKHIKLLQSEFRKLGERIIIKDVIDDDKSYFEFEIKNYIELLITPLLDFTLNEIELCMNEKDISLNNIKSLNWNGTQTELMELIKSLIENGNLQGKQKDVISVFTTFLNFEIKNPNKLITDIKNRNTGSETLFLDSLKSSLYNYITKENKR